MRFCTVDRLLERIQASCHSPASSLIRALSEFLPKQQSSPLPWAMASAIPWLEFCLRHFKHFTSFDSYNLIKSNQSCHLMILPLYHRGNWNMKNFSSLLKVTQSIVAASRCKHRQIAQNWNALPSCPAFRQKRSPGNVIKSGGDFKRCNVY